MLVTGKVNRIEHRRGRRPVGSYLMGNCHCKSENKGGYNDVLGEGFIAE